jgi:hypothetical protein
MKGLVLNGLVRRFEKKSSTMKTDRYALEVKEAPNPNQGRACGDRFDHGNDRKRK